MSCHEKVIFLNWSQVLPGAAVAEASNVKPVRVVDEVLLIKFFHKLSVKRFSTLPQSGFKHFHINGYSHKTSHKQKL